MVYLLISLAVANAVFLLFYAFFNWIAAIFPALVALVVTYILLARRTSKQIEQVGPEVNKALTGRRFDQAIKTLEDAKHTTRHQFLMGKMLDAQIGMILYAHKQDFDAAKPHLENAHGKNWQALSMLGAYHYKKKNWAEMEKVFERACKKNKKSGMVWAAHAWCQWKRGEKNKAMTILSEALKHQPDDEKLKSNLLALQNDKRMKMRGYEPEWWALHLEKIPQQTMVQRGAGGRGGFGGKRGGRKKR
jgi:tetratricopeptide (TPR) repeat protein